MRQSTACTRQLAAPLCMAQGTHTERRHSAAAQMILLRSRCSFCLFALRVDLFFDIITGK